MQKIARSRLFIMASIAVAAVAVAVFLAVRPTGSPEYRKYKEYMGRLHAEWDVSQDTAESFAEGNCRHLEGGGQPGFKIQNKEHLNATAALLAAYCPNAMGPYLDTVRTLYPAYQLQAKTIENTLYNVESTN
ncbi:hypothetical protein [Streptomyces sp. NPDC007905]|uniref:hypothetical protein n=1 Tax=Streptomyces sp. NPDC007905 TaxID=3364788 RepID=UPI0036F12451